jgi:subtilisin family serine protease
MKFASAALLPLSGLLASSALAGDASAPKQEPWDEVGLPRSSWPVLDPEAWHSTFSGLGSYIYVINDGVDATHNDLRGRVTTANLGPSGFEEMRGGTAVAGVAAGTRYGVAKMARIIDVYGVNSRARKTDIFNQALEWTLDDIVSYGRQNVSVVNVSLTLDKRMTCPDYLQASFRRFYEAGIPVVVSAGDKSIPAMTVCPAHLDTVITVGGMKHSGRNSARASGSNYGPTVDLFAVSDNIVVPTSSLFATDLYIPVSGTLVAAAHASGMVASLLAYDERFGEMTPDQLKRWLQVEARGMDMRDGRGLPNTRLVLADEPELWMRAVGGLMTAAIFVSMVYILMATLIVSLDALMALIEGLPRLANVQRMV